MYMCVRVWEIIIKNNFEQNLYSYQLLADTWRSSLYLYTNVKFHFFIYIVSPPPPSV